MSDYVSMTVFAVRYENLDDAEADYKAVKDLYYDLGLMDTFDAAVLYKKDNGKVKIKEKHEQPTRHGGWVGAGWGLATGLANGAFWALAPVFTAGLSSDTSLAAWFMTSTVIGGALAQWPLGFLSDKFGRRKTLLGAAVIVTIVAATIMMLVGELGFIGINLLGAAWGFSAFPMYTISVAHANDHAEPSDYVMVSSGLLLVFGIGAVLGPFAASAMIVFAATSGLYLLTGLVHLLLAIYIAMRMSRRDSTPIEDRITFSDAMATAHTASQVYEEEIMFQAEDEDAAPEV